MTNLKEKIISKLSEIKGKKWTQKELSDSLQTSTREIRKQIGIINKTIDEDNFIILSGQKGFWITEDKTEIKENVQHLRSQALKMLKRYHTIIKKSGFPEKNIFDGIQ